MCSVLWRNKMDRRSRIIWFAVERIFDSRRIVDIVAMTTFTAYSVHSQRMPISTTPQIEVTLSQSDWHKVGSVDGGSANRRSRNWRSKMHGKTKHSWSTINSEHQVNRRSVNRRSNLIWLEMEKPDLSDLNDVYKFFSTPRPVRNPTFQYFFRALLIICGKAV